MARVGQELVQNIPCGNTQGRGILAGVAAEPLRLVDTAIHGEGDAVIGVVQEAEDGGRADLAA